MTTGLPGGDRSSERPAKDNNLMRVHLAFLYQVRTRSFHIYVCAALAGLSLALAVTTLVEDKDSQPKLVEYLDRIEPVGYIACVAMAKQNHTSDALTGNKPAGELQSVRGFK